MCFKEPPLSFCINNAELHIWYLDITAVESRYSHLADVLSKEENKRASAYYFEKHRVKFTITRAFLRILLARYLSCSPFDIHFVYNKYGKPQLKKGHFIKDLNFNLSHSHNGALYAFCQNTRVGVDLEKITNINNLKDLARFLFNKQEINTFINLPKKKQKNAFFYSWSRKEALYKALGLGIGSKFNCTLLLLPPGSSQRISALGSDWFIQDLQVNNGFTAAFCIENSLPQICLYHISVPFINSALEYLKAYLNKIYK